MDGDGAPIRSGLRMRLSLISESPKVFMETVDADIARLNSSRLADASGNINAAISVAQTGTGVVQILGNCVRPLGQTLQLIVKIMDSIADVCLRSAFKMCRDADPAAVMAGTSHIEGFLDCSFFSIQGEHPAKD